MALALVGVLGLDFETASAGVVIAKHRQTVDLGQRATVVAEPDARLSWSGDGTSATVLHHEGAAFYRVAPGADLVVQTPYGRLSGRRTSFAVEVDSMTKSRKAVLGGGVGVVAVAGWLTVYQGTVEVEAEAGTQGPADVVRAGPGDLVRFDADGVSVSERGAGSEPSRPLAPPTSPHLAETQEQALALQRRVRELEDQLEALQPPDSDSASGSTPQDQELSEAERVDRCLRRGGPGCSFVDPDPGVLLRLAQMCNVRSDHPAFLSSPTSSAPSPTFIEDAALSDEEVETITAANETYLAEHDQRLHEVYLELGGDPETVRDLPRAAVEGLVWDAIPDRVATDTIAAIARERAGLVDAPASIDDPGERFTRAMLDLGSDYEHFLAQRLGAERAHDLRQMHDGWADTSTYGSGQCPAQ